MEEKMKNKTTIRKTLNFVQIIFYAIILLIMVCSPYTSYKVYEMKVSPSSFLTEGPPVYYTDYTEVVEEGTIHLWDYFEHTFSLVWSLLPVFLVFMGIIISGFSIIRKSFHRDSKLHSVIPVLTFLSFYFLIVFIDIINYSAPSYHVEKSGTTPFLPVSVLLLIVFVLALIKRSKSFNPEPVVKVEMLQTSSANEIKQYKELLDSGAITQEEYDVKKKELLGL
jgi:hypothetical protein